MSNDRRQRRPLYAPPPPPNRGGRQHSVLGYWVPIIVTGTIAIGGLAAWIWSERQDHDDDDHYPHDKPSQGRPPYAPGQDSQPRPPGGYAGQQGASVPTSHQGPIPSQSGGMQGQPPPAPGSGVPGAVGGEAASYYGASRSHEGHGREDEQTFFGQVRGAMRRTPSPQQFFDQASRQVSAGLAAAGNALGSIIEDSENGSGTITPKGGRDRRGVNVGREEREGFSDHERWSEEADEKVRIGRVEAESERRVDAARREEGKGKGRKKKLVAVVVSADTNMDGKMDEDDVVYSEHASILSHLPEHHNPSTTELFVLIYAPGLTHPPPLSYRPSMLDTIETASNLGSSYSQINTPLATPGTELQSISPRIDPTTSQTTSSPEAEKTFESPGRQFDALYTTALTLTTPAQILTFTTPTGYLSILRHLSPSLAYVSDLLAGKEGDAIAQLRGWVGQSVLVVGDDGTGGLADTETEEEGEDGHGGKKEMWWEHSNLVGLGKGLEIVDAARMGEDWGRRVARGE